MNKISIIIISLVLSVSLFSDVAFRGNLSLDYNDLNEAHTLNGEWKLSVQGEDGYFITVPGFWSNIEGVPKTGWAEYSLTVHINNGKGQYASLYDKEHHSAYIVYIDDKEIGRSGTFSKEKAPQGNFLQPHILNFQIPDETFTIKIRISNYDMLNSGLKNSPILGTPAVIQNMWYRTYILEVFIIGILFIMAIYHFMLFIMNLDNKAYFFFSFFTLVITIRLGLSGQRILHSFFWTVQTTLFTKFDFLTAYWAPVLFYLYLNSIYKGKAVKYLPTISVINATLFSLFTLLTPSRWTSMVDQYNYLVTLLFALDSFKIIFIELKNKHSYSYLFLIALIALFLGYMNDVIVTMYGLSWIFLTPYALITFTLIQVYWLSKNYAKSYNKLLEHSDALNDTVKAYKRFVPENFLQFLNKDHISKVQLGDQIETEMSIMFCSIHSLPEISSSISTLETFDLLNSFLSIAAPVVEAHGGYIDKIVGNGFMALFPDEAVSALHASKEIIQNTTELNKSLEQKNHLPLSVGIGINRGLVMLGTVGHKDRMECTVISDAVNLASRLVGLSKVFGAQIIISRNFFVSSMESNELRFLGKIRVKGKEKITQVFEIIQDEYKHLQVDDFERGLQHFFSRDFESAKSIFMNLFNKNPLDLALKYYIDRINEITPEQLKDSWQGEVDVIFK